MENKILNLVQSNSVYFVIVVSAIIGKIKESSKSNMLSAWLIYLIGTIFHELAHFFVSLITFGKPSWISLLPSSSINEKTGQKSYTLGYVSSKNMRWWNTFFIAMAPLLLLPLSYYVYLHFFDYFKMSIFGLTAYIFIIVSLVFSAIPSGVDFSHIFNKNVIANLAIPIFIGIGIYLTYKNNLLTIRSLF